MNEPTPPPPRYRWPWLVAAAVLLAILLAIFWVRLEVKKVERERDFDAPVH